MTLKEDLAKAKSKKDKAKTEDETITDQFKRGITYRKDQIIAIGKDKIKSIFKKKKKKYGQTDILINK